jgi:UDP:flavonoid glycosyltransferase YjiC (YdhE family)
MHEQSHQLNGDDVTQQKCKKRVLFMAEAVTLAHVGRPLVLASALDPARYDVHFACARGYEFCFENSAFTRWTIESIAPHAFLRALAQGSVLYDEKTLAQYVEDELRLFQEIKPDLVVGDFRLSLAVSAPLWNVPYAAIVNAHWSPYSTIRHPPFPDHPIAKTLGLGIASAGFRFAYPLIFAQHSQPLNRVRQKRGLSRLGSLRDVYCYGSYTLYADSPKLARTRDLPANHTYIGPVLWSPPVPLPKWWDELPNDRPTVYITLGSSGELKALPLILDVLAGLPVNTIVATAGRQSIQANTGRVWTAEFLPGIDAARRSSLVICNGGSATVYQALGAGVPVLGVNSNMDQCMTMKCVEDAGVGKSCRAGSVNIHQLRASISEILSDPRYRERASRIAHDVCEYNAPERFSQMVASWIN